ncbi:MAG: ornithine--oxo-acid transaminase [Thermotogota bacterium]
MKYTKGYVQQALKWSANNYHPLEVVIEKGLGSWVWDVDGNKYLDMLAAYSAVNQGHCHPKIMSALTKQANKLTISSRAFHNDKMGKFLKKLCQLTGYEKALPMNTGTEAVETALKLARKWGEKKKGVEKNHGKIIACENNFAGRTITIISFSSEDQNKDGFGPFTPGFEIIEYGNDRALENAIDENTVAFIVEPIQGEGGILIPPKGYLKKIREITQKKKVLLLLDEIQTGFGRTGKLFAHYHEGIRPDILIMGKALSGGAYPVSAVVCDDEIMDVIQPGEHGSTFGGNPLGAAVASAALDVIIEEKLSERSNELGSYFIDKLRTVRSERIKEIRGKGLFIGVEIKPEHGTARRYTEALREKGLLCKETHEQTIRFAPPLVIKKEELDWAFAIIRDVLVHFD